nr:hypothetical protein [Tanacetum cinerariifolium]
MFGIAKVYKVGGRVVKIDVIPLAPKLQNNRTARNDYLKHTQEETTTLREIVKNERLLNPLNTSLDYACCLNCSLVFGLRMLQAYDRRSLSAHQLCTKILGTVKFRNDHVAKIMGYGDYKIGNVTILRVYFVEGLGHNLFSVGQFCDLDLEVAFRQHTCFIRNLDGVDLLTGSRGNNLYTLSLKDMMASSPICRLSKASKTKSWLWHRRLSHLNFESVNGKKYILVIVDDYSRFTWVKCLRSKDEAPDFIIKFLKMIQVRLKVLVRCIQTDNGTEFVNQTLREYYEQVGISHETSVARSPQQNGVVERSPAVIAPIADVIPPVQAESTGSPSSTTVDQDVPSPMEPKMYKDALTQSCLTEAMQEELNEFKRLELDGHPIPPDEGDTAIFPKCDESDLVVVFGA